MRNAIVVAIVLLGCDVAPGAVHLRAPGVAGELVIDGETRGPVQAEQTIELAPGPHRIAIFDGPRERVASQVEVRSRMVAEVEVDPSQLDAFPPIAAPPPELAAIAAAQAAAEERMRAEQAAMEAERARLESEIAGARAAAEAAQAEAAHVQAVQADAVQPEAAPAGDPLAVMSRVREIQDRARALRTACAAHATEAARLEVTLHVREDGHVDRADVTGEGPAALRACARSEIRRWVLAPGDDTEIRLPVVVAP